MGDNSFEKIDIQLVFDTNILVDALVSRGSYFHYAVDLLTMVEKGHVEGWYAPHTLTILSDTFVFELRLDYLVHFLVFAPIVLLWRLGFPRIQCGPLWRWE